MTDATLTQPPTPSRPGRGLKIALAVSVALNLGVAGLIAGMALDGGPGRHGDMMARDLGFGPFDGALLPQDRDALRQNIQGRIAELRTARRQMQADNASVLTALRADPFDQTALSTALNTQAQHLGDRLTIGSDVIRDYLTALPKDARLAFADRLEHRMRHGKDGDGKDGDTRNGDGKDGAVPPAN